MNTKNGFVALVLVLIVSMSIGTAMYVFFERNTYMLSFLREEGISESKRLFTRSCVNVIDEGVYAGMPSTYFKTIQPTINIFNKRYSCVIKSASIERVLDGYVYSVILEVSDGVVSNIFEIRYQITPSGVNKKFIFS
ncbi:MAG: hypothetical protein FGM57_00065 [Candidatus Taylorbacteria bacterium]|nr:hypothetical protein [Candidatus Taylorbacteria bacterium]